MKKRVSRILGFSSLLSIFCAAIYIHYKRDQYSIETEKSPFFVLSPRDSVLTIGVVGDSWVADHQLDTIIENKIRRFGIKCKVISSGQWGAYTKNVYQNLFKDPGLPFSGKPVITANPEYCCIISGNNDVDANAGLSFYSAHLMLIIKLLSYYGIKPVVISIAAMETNIPRRPTFFQKIRKAVKGIFLNNEKHSVEEYNLSFINMLNQSPYRDKVLIIDIAYEPQEKVYVDYRNLSVKPYHLSPGGNSRLGIAIAEKIMKDYSLSHPVVQK